MKRPAIATAMVIAAIGVALLAPSQAPPAAAVDRGMTVVPSSAADIAVPRLAEPRVRLGADGLVVDVAVQVDAHHVSGARQDVAHLQVAVVSPETGEFVVGPQQALPVTASRLHATVALTQTQGALFEEWRRTLGWRVAANAVTVGVRHDVDTDATHPGIDAQGIDARISRWGGADPVAPMGQLRGISSNIAFVNSTPNPLVLLAGPANCIYDSNYPLQAGSDNASDFLAQLNGAVVPAGVTLTTSTSSSQDTGDNKYVTQSGSVFAAYSAAVTSTYQWFSKTSAKGTLPRIPAKGTLPAEITGSQAQLVQSLLIELAQDSTAEGAVVDNIYTGASTAAGGGLIWASAADAFDLPGIDQVLGIIGVLIDVFDTSCESSYGSLLVGATDATHPWRQFVGLYNWNVAVPELLKGPKNESYRPYVNGMVVNVWSTPQSMDTSDVSADQLQMNFEPLPQPRQYLVTYTFAEPDNNADYPADVTISGRTVTCALDPRDKTSQQQAMNAITAHGTSWFLTGYPNAVWQKLADATTATTYMPMPWMGVNSYVDGIGYAAPGTSGVVSVYTSADGQNWSAPILAAPNSSSVTIPTGTPARLVQCTTQSVETWNDPITYNGRRVIMGTRVMSDMVLGPDA